MNGKLQSLYISVIVLTLSSWVDSKDFCSAFRDNGNRISFTYRRFYGPTNSSHQIPILDIVINGYFWRLEFVDMNANKNLTVNRQGMASPLFTDQFHIATCIRARGKWTWEKGRAVLFSKSDWTKLVVGDIPNDDYTVAKDLSHYQYSQTLTLNEYYGQLFVFDDMDTYPYCTPCYKLVIIRVNDTQSKATSQFEPWLYYVYVNDSNMRLSPYYLRETYLDKYNAIRQLKSPYKVVGIVPQVGSDTKYGLIFLFVDDLKVRWCWSLGTQLDQSACGVGAEVLIDCSATDLPPPKESSFPFYVIYICFIILIIIVIGVIVFLMAANRKAKREVFNRSKISPKSSSKASTETGSVKKDKSPSPPKSPGSVKSVRSPSPPKSPGATSKAVGVPKL